MGCIGSVAASGPSVVDEKSLAGRTSGSFSARSSFVMEIVAQIHMWGPELAWVSTQQPAQHNAGVHCRISGMRAHYRSLIAVWKRRPGAGGCPTRRRREVLPAAVRQSSIWIALRQPDVVLTWCDEHSTADRRCLHTGDVVRKGCSSNRFILFDLFVLYMEIHARKRTTNRRTQRRQE